MSNANPYQSPDAPPTRPRDGSDGSWRLRSVFTAHGCLLAVGYFFVVFQEWPPWRAPDAIRLAIAGVYFVWMFAYPVFGLIGVAELRERSWSGRAWLALLVVGLWFPLLWLLLPEVK